MDPPTSPQRLHLLPTAGSRALFPKLDSPRTASTACSKPHDAACAPPLSALDRVPTQRVYSSTVSYLDSAPPGSVRVPGKPRPPVTPRVTHTTNNHTSHHHHHPHQQANDGSLLRDEFLVLHPSLDLTDETGELSQLLLNRWSPDSGEHYFTSVSLFCEMKLSEAKRMTSWVERPNRFFTTVCCQLLAKYAQQSGAAFLTKLHEELLAAIFMDGSPSSIPFFLEYKRLRRHAQVLMATVENREQSAATKEQLPVKIDKLLASHKAKADRRLVAMLFRSWRRTTASENEARALKCKAFRAARKLNIGALFRGWRIEALRRAYQRESVEYQTMLSITAASLSRKDVQLAENESKLQSMGKIIDSLTESNAQLLYRVEQLEAIASGRGGSALMALHGQGNGLLGYHRSAGAAYDSIDSLGTDTSTANAASSSADDEKSDRTNRMLLETMFGMARMVESCAIQMSKDMMDSLEQQLDGSMLQQLAEMIHADNVAAIKAEEARGMPMGSLASPPPSSPGLARRNGTLRKTTSVMTNHTMLASLGKGAVAVKDLAHMPVDAFLLAWFRMHLQLSTAAEKPSDRNIKNFTTDLVDGRRFSFLLHRLSPTWFDLNMVHEIDADERLRNIAAFHARVQPELPLVVTSDSIHSGSSTENVAFTAMLFGQSIAATRRINLERQREKFLHILTSWKRVRSLLLEVKRMNDNYDALMVVHLLKEMRTCETLFKQLNAELGAVAIASNESAATLASVAYKILHLTWRCLHVKITSNGATSLDLVDERLAERVKDFTHVDLATVRQLLVNDAQYATARLPKTMMLPPPQAVPERDVLARTEAMANVLAVYCKDLHDIFKHYSASGGAGSIASLSLSEFVKFLRDCALVADAGAAPPPAKHHSTSTTVSNAMVDFIYRASLFFSPLTPRELIYAAMVHGSTANNAVNGAPSPTASAMVLPTADPLQPDSAILSLDFGVREMVGHEFVDALVRLAAIKCPVAVSSNSTLIEDRFREFMESHILPNALRSQSEIFRAEVASPKVRAVFQKHKPTLQRIFKYYTSMHALREQQSTMDLKELTIFAKDCKLIGSFVTEHTLKQVLVNLQREDAVAPTNNDDAAVLRVDFADFLEAIAALTEYVICNPYVPLYKRIEQFINENILPRARQKKKAVGE